MARSATIIPFTGTSGAAPPPVWEDTPGARRYARERRVARDLVELSRLTRGGETAECTFVDLARLVGAIRADYPQLEVSGGPSVLVNTDSRRLARILFTVLDNAHLHGAPPVSLSYDEAEMVVRDRGRGFAPALLARATEPFVIGEGALGRGVGLGLAIAAAQAALLRAELVLANRPEGGASVTVLFDAPEPAAA